MKLHDRNIYTYESEHYDCRIFWPVINEKEAQEVFALCKKEKLSVSILAFEIQNWNQELSPWSYGEFGNGANKTLEWILEVDATMEKVDTYIMGYSLAGLFSLWCCTKTDLFKGVGSCSASFWFSGFTDYLKDHSLYADKIYLSLGKKEAKTRHPVLSTVKDKTLEVVSILDQKGMKNVMVWNNGNHFYEVEKRMFDCVKWLIEKENKDEN